jgi:hypothetical protein
MFGRVSTEIAQRAACAALSWVIVGLLGCSAYDPELLQFSALTSGTGRVDAGPVDAGSVRPAVDEPDADVPAATRCGDGVITGEEKCDIGIEAGQSGACPMECPPLVKCAPRALNGTGCRAECALLQLVCESGDDCCPASCTAENDGDCSASCGDGIVQRDRGELCEPDSREPCKASAAECSDDNACTVDALVGSARNCNAVCTNTPLSESLEADGCCPEGTNANVDADCQPICGNGVREAGEECDQPSGCDANCRSLLEPEQMSCLEQFGGADECARCSCLNCTDPFVACNTVGGEAEVAKCLAVLECSRRNNCVGAPCYCGDSAFCVAPRGPCQREVEEAAGTTDPLMVEAQRADPNTTLGRVYAADQCSVNQCRDVCRP